MGDSSSSTGGSADSYIGSLISLTSKSEIRYEGILYTIDTQNSNIALQDVRSFGTEGRKKDGPQIPPSDKVYEYIIFRGSDIKDLQVKFSPPVQTASQIHSDPAIISLQSEYSQPASAPTAFGTIGSGSLPDLNSHGAHSVAPASPFPGATPLYQAGGSLGSWGTLPPPPGVNGTGLAMPLYWPGYYGPAGGLPHIQQQAMHFPRSHGMPIPHAIQQQLQQSSPQASLPTALSTSSDFARPLQQPLNLTLSSTESSSVIAPVPVVPDASTTKVTTVSDGVPMPSLSTESLATGLLPIVTLGPSNQEASAVMTPVSSKPHTVMGSTSSFQVISQSVPTTVPPGPLSLPTSVAPALVTPGQLLQPGGSVSSFKSPSSSHEHNVGNVVSSQPLISGPSDSQPWKTSTQPLLPLPKTTSRQRPHQQVNGMVGHSGINLRGRGKGRGRGAPHAVARFTEDFDFIAMNEKFNKDEVWGHLGKGELRDKAEDGEEDDTVEGNVEDEEDLGQSSKSDPKPVYVKDDFFDSLSCDALGRGLRTERTKFSEQRKIDTETFGNFALRSRVGRVGRGGGHQGNFRGSYYGGRGNGYTGRGRAGGRTVL